MSLFKNSIQNKNIIKRTKAKQQQNPHLTLSAFYHHDKDSLPRKREVTLFNTLLKKLNQTEST